MASKSVTQKTVMDALEWAYGAALKGGVGFDSALKMAEDYRGKHGSVRKDVNALIRWQNAKAGTSGFITGLGGLLTLPVAIPANIASVLFV